MGKMHLSFIVRDPGVKKLHVLYLSPKKQDIVLNKYFICEMG